MILSYSLSGTQFYYIQRTFFDIFTISMTCSCFFFDISFWIYSNDLLIQIHLQVARCEIEMSQGKNNSFVCVCVCVFIRLCVCLSVWFIRITKYRNFVINRKPFDVITQYYYGNSRIWKSSGQNSNHFFFLIGCSVCIWSFTRRHSRIILFSFG